MTATRDKRLAAGIWALSPLAVLLLGATVIVQPALMPTHWGFSDEVDAVATGGGYLAATFSITAAAACGAAVVGGLARFLSSWTSRWLMSALTTIGGFSAASYLVTALVTNLARSPQDVSPLWVLLTLVIAAAWGYSCWAIHGRSMPARAEVISAIPGRSRIPKKVREGELPWSAQTASGVLKATGWFIVFIAVTCTGIILATGSGLFSGLFVAVSLGLTAAACFLLASMDFSVTEAGLRGRTTVGGIGVFNVPASEVLGVELTKVKPMEWGGNGLRFSRKGTAYVANGGPGVVIYRASGSNLAIELSDEYAAAAAYDALRLAASQAASRPR